MDEHQNEEEKTEEDLTFERITQPAVHRSGFVTVVGRPNVGKSSLINTLCGEKIAITSNKPQTTRHQIRGVLTMPNAQLVFVDTPGIHKPKTPLGERLNQRAVDGIPGVDTVSYTHLTLPTKA